MMVLHPSMHRAYGSRNGSARSRRVWCAWMQKGDQPDAWTDEATAYGRARRDCLGLASHPACIPLGVGGRPRSLQPRGAGTTGGGAGICEGAAFNWCDQTPLWAARSGVDAFLEGNAQLSVRFIPLLRRP